MKISVNEDSNEVFNCSLTLVNLLDEIDWVVGGYGKPTPQFLYSLNAFIESFILNDEIFVSFGDAMHINLASPLFENGRPILNMLVKNGLLRVIVEGNEHLIDAVGTVIYTFQTDNDKTLDKNDEWIQQYKKNVNKELLSKILVSYTPGTIPTSTPLLMLGGSSKSSNKAIAIFEREVNKCLSSVLSLSLGSRLHPVLPLYAVTSQIDFFKSIPISLDLYRKMADVYNVNTEEILKHCGYSRLPLPPLTTILLSRCRSKEEIPFRLKELRDEFSSLREVCRLHEIRLNNTLTLREQFEVIKEYEEFWESFSKRYKNRSTRLIFRIWDIVKEANPLKYFTKSVDNLIEWDQERVILNRFKGLLDMWNLTLQAPSIQNQLSDVERLFGSAVNTNDWNSYAQHAKNIEKQIFPSQ